MIPRRTLHSLVGLTLVIGSCAQPVSPGSDAGSDGPAVDLARPQGDSLPPGTVSFFNRNSCPTGWTALGTAAGRLLVPTLGAVGGGTFVGRPLASGEDRQHSHPFSASVTPPQTAFAGSASGTGANLATADPANFTGTTSSASTGLPYVQLLVCVKSAAPRPDLPPPPAGMMSFFSNISTCPSGWTQVAVTQGRFLVGLPDQGVAAVTFGGNALASQEDRGHTHPLRGSLTTISHGLTIADGSTATGYARNGTYSYVSTTDSTPADLPYLQLLHCQKN